MTPTTRAKSTPKPSVNKKTTIPLQKKVGAKSKAKVTKIATPVTKPIANKAAPAAKKPVTKKAASVKKAGSSAVQGRARSKEKPGGGKKAAQARRKANEAHKSMSNSRHAAPKPLVSRPKQQSAIQTSEDEEDDAGRASSFKSKSKRINGHGTRESSDMMIAGTKDGSEPYLDGGSGDDTTVPSERRNAQRLSRTKTSASYLDELLAIKAKKGKKQKKKTQSESES